MSKIVFIACFLFTSFCSFGQAKVAKFHVSENAVSIAGWTNVYGNPATGVPTATDATTGFGFRSTGISNWNKAYGNDNASDGFGETVDDGGGFAMPAGVVANLWYNYSDVFTAGVYQTQVFGLNPAKTYTLVLLGSRGTANGATGPRATDYNVKGITTLTQQTLDNWRNTSHTVTFSNVQPDVSGFINIAINRKSDGTGGVFGYLNGLIVTENATNNPPSANAGVDQTITLPTNSVTVNGSGTDPDGTITSYAWTKVSGGAATITSPSSASTTITGLVQGVYVFRLTVTDNGGATAFDDVQITVNAAATTSANWSVSGNTISTNDFIGTTNAADLIFKTNNIQQAKITSTGNVLINTITDAGHKFQVRGNAYFTGNTNKSVFVDADNGSINVIGTEGGAHSLNIERNSTAINNFIRMYDNATGGQIKIGGVSSNSFSPGIFFKPGGSGYNSSFIISEVVDVGTGAAIILDGRKSNSSLSNQPLLSVDSYGNPKLTVSANGNLMLTGSVGLGTFNSEPSGFNGSILYNSSTNQFKGYRNGEWKNFLMEGDASGSSSWSITGTTIYNSNSGNVGIGTTDTKGYKFAVNGDAIFTKIKVKQYPWADYVFDDDYKLPTLQEVEEYIKKHKHLPDVPSAKEVGQNGLDVGDNQAVLLKKIEELTLYIIEQNKKIEKQDKKIEDLQLQNKELSDIKIELEVVKTQLKN